MKAAQPNFERRIAAIQTSMPAVNKRCEQMIEWNPQVARKWIDEVDGREHRAVEAKLAWIGSPIQPEAVDQFRMLEEFDLPFPVAFVGERIFGS